MLTALLITLLPTLLAYILLKKIGLKPKSAFLSLTLSWFTGMYFFTIITFVIAVVFNTFTSAVLLKATYAVLLLTQLVLFFFIKDVHHILVTAKHAFIPFNHKKIISVLLIVFCFTFAYFFYSNHLTIEDGQIYTTQIYWDFHWHAALINNFAYGDNFPPQNEAFSGLPHTYHFFWGVIAAIYEVAGLNLANAINFISIVAFAFILIALIGLSEEFFHTRRVGFIAVVLTITSSSLLFLHYFAVRADQNIFQTLVGIFDPSAHPWYTSFLPGNAFGYNGTMANLFYFLEERQMIFGVVYLLLSLWILWKRDHLNNKLLFFIGAAMGAYFLWHLHITIMILCAMLFLLIFAKDRNKTLILLTGFLIVFIAHYIYFKIVMQSEWFYSDIDSFPRLNFGFASGENEPFSMKDVLVYYLFTYGFKILFLILSFVYLFKKNRKLFLLFSSIILPTFIILNTIQLSPASIYENHKWFRPMNVVIDLATAFIFIKLFFEKKTLLVRSAGIVCFFALTISGVIELAPFLNAKPTLIFAEYPSSITKAVTEHSEPHDTFTGTDIDEINLAGRKVFLGNNLGGDMRFKKRERRVIIEDIYHTKNLTDFCKLTKKYDIDFVEFDHDSYSPLKEMAREFPHFTAISSSGEEVIFVDIKKSCR